MKPFDRSLLQYWKGKKRPPRTEKHKRKLRQAHINNPNYEKLAKRLSIIHKGKHYSPNTEFQKGKHYSSETEFKKGHKSWTKDISPDKHPCWKGGRMIDGGYVHIYSPNHPFNNQKYVPEHRLVVEKFIKRYLKPEEVVHHINENTLDNRIENLMVFSNSPAHIRFHHYSNKADLEYVIFDGST